jgi:hypothetical protein
MNQRRLCSDDVELVPADCYFEVEQSSLQEKFMPPRSRSVCDCSRFHVQHRMPTTDWRTAFVNPAATQSIS